MDVNTIITDAGGIDIMARRLGVDRASVYDWKRKGAFPASRVFQISDALGVSLDELRVLTTKPRGSRRSEAP